MTNLVDRLLPDELWQRIQPLLPAKELGCGSATTCWRRFDQWAKAGVFDQLQALLLDELGEAGRIDLERVSVDSFSLRAVKGGT